MPGMLAAVLLGVAVAIGSPPSSIAIAPDGRTVYVALDRVAGHGGGIAAYARDGATLRALGRVDVPGGLTSVAVTNDGATLVVANRVGLGALSASALARGSLHAIAMVRDSDAPRTNQVAISSDGRYAFATNSEAATLSVARIGNVSDGEPTIDIVGHVSLDFAPDGLTLSPDGSTIYVTSEVAAGNLADLPGSSDARLGRTHCTVNLGWNGVLSAIDVRTAIADPRHAVVARIAAGCAPARVAISPDGRTAWVSVRGEDRLLGIDVRRMRDDPGQATVADIAVGVQPIGLAFSADGQCLLVANSHRRGDVDDVAGSTLMLIDVGAAVRGGTPVLATIPTGAFAREVVRAPDGTYFVTDYKAKAIDIVTLPRSANHS